MFFLNLKLKKPLPWRGHRWADLAKHGSDRKVYCTMRVWGVTLTISSMAVALASRWGRWGSRRGRRRCWRWGAAGRRSSWVWGEVQLSSWRPRGKSSLDCRRPAAQETYTQHTLSIYSGQTSYLLQDVSIFGSTWLWLSTQDVCTSILCLSTPHISRQTLRLFCFLLFFTIVVLIKSHKIHTLYFTHIPWSSMLFDI